MYFVTRVPSIKGMDSFDTLIDAGENIGESETLGYFETLKEAEHAVESRDIDRTLSGPKRYVVIEKIGPGLLPSCDTIKWYVFNEVTEKYRIIDNSDCIIVNHAEIG